LRNSFAKISGLLSRLFADVSVVIAIAIAIVSLPVAAAADAPAKMAVSAKDSPATASPYPSIARDPADLPKTSGKAAYRHHKWELTPKELVGQIDDGAAYGYWTFDGKVPGPFLRMRVGDTADLTLANAKDNKHFHNIDLHAVSGAGGGAGTTTIAPGESKSFFFKATAPGIFVYHCAMSSIPQHISNGMYGLILVEPEKGLTKVDHEFYVMQGDMYTEEKRGAKGVLNFSPTKMDAEHPEFVVFNGSADGLIKQPMKAKVGETVRIFFGVGGPNLTSSFRVIGEIFDKVYRDGSLTSAPVTNVQTTQVTPGSATIVEFKLEVPGTYILVDNALSRLGKGGAGLLVVEGDPRPAIFKPGTRPVGR